MFLWRRVKPDWVLASPASTFRASTATNTSHGQIQIKTKTNTNKNKNKFKYKNFPSLYDNQHQSRSKFVYIQIKTKTKASTNVSSTFLSNSLIWSTPWKVSSKVQHNPHCIEVAFCPMPLSNLNKRSIWGAEYRFLWSSSLSSLLVFPLSVT